MHYSTMIIWGILYLTAMVICTLLVIWTLKNNGGYQIAISFFKNEKDWTKNDKMTENVHFYPLRMVRKSFLAIWATTTDSDIESLPHCKL